MRIAVCGGVAVICATFAFPALAQKPAAPQPGAPPGYAPPPGAPPAAPPGYAPPPSAPPGYAPPPYGAPPPGYYPPPPPESQERTALNGLYFEFLGPAILYSINYDRVISDFALRVGFGYVSLSASTSSAQAHAYFATFPFDVNYIGIGSKKHMFEIGGGATVLLVGQGASLVGVDSNDSASQTAVYGHLNIGYRLQPPHGGFMLRTGISPLIGSGGFLPWPYVALGGTF